MKTTNIVGLLVLALVLVSCPNPTGGPNTPPGTIPPVDTSIIPEGNIRVHYKRLDGVYTGWGLHLWNLSNSDPAITGAVGTTWAAPRLATGTNSFGVYFNIPVIDITKGLNFIMHKGDLKDVSADRTFPQTGEIEFWLISGDATVYTSDPGLTAISPTFTSTTVITTSFSATLRDADTVSLVDGEGVEIPATVVRSGTSATFTSASPWDLSKVHFVKLNANTYQVGYSRAVLSDPALIYDGDDLGATLDSSGGVTFKVWSPGASAVTVQMFDTADSLTTVGAPQALTRGAAGVWSLTLAAGALGIDDFNGYYYQYAVTANGVTNTALDPYAKSMAAFRGGLPNQADYIGKAAIVDLNDARAGTKPTRPLNSTRMSSRTDVVIYEVHVRDYTITNPDVTESLRGTFAGFAEAVEHLVELGVTHVQLLPVNNHFRVDELNRAYQGEVANPNFNWGYDPHSYFSLEGQYSTDANDPYARIDEFRDLVNTLHANGIGVVMDVVYNHTYSNSVLNNVAPGLHYRPAGGFTPVGDPAVESRNPMTRKLIIDNVKMWVEEFGIDGFRFDLMGFMDVETMRAIRAAVGDDILLYGEAWNFTDLPDADKTVKGHKGPYPYDAEIGLFNDTIRDSFKGSGENGHQTYRGFVQGSSDISRVIAGFVAGVDSFTQPEDPAQLFTNDRDDYQYFAEQPADSIQYLEVHDGFTLWDKINFTIDGTAAERSRYYRQASAMLFTSQGRILIQAGQEFGRAKPRAANDPEPGRAATTPLVNADPDIPGVLYLHNNTYSSSDYTNQIRWGRKTDAVNGFATNYAYYRGLIAMRRKIPAFRYSSASQMSEGLRFAFQTVPATVPGGTSAGYTSITQAPELTVEFYNGPANSTYYIVGEVFNTTNKNPATNSYGVVFDADGRGSFTFTAQQIAAFETNLSVWGGVAGVLDLKLVATRGQWDSVPGAYSGEGNNKISPASILTGNVAHIDLSVVDYAATATPAPMIDPESVLTVVFELDNTLDPSGDATDYDRLLVVHNAKGEAVTVNSASLGSGTWTLILDDDEAGVSAVTAAPAGYALSTASVTVPANTSIVLARTP